MNELNEMELSQIDGGTVTLSGIAASFGVGGFTGAVAAAVTATTIAALGVPALVGGTIALSAYLVHEAISEGVLAAEAVYQAY